MSLLALANISYLGLFIIMVFEGPIATSAAAFAVHLGLFTLPMIFVLSVAGDIVGDFLYYGIGWASRKTLITKHGHRFGLGPENIERFDKAFKKHKIKSLVIAKLAPAIPGPVLIAAGALGIPLWTLIWLSFVLAVPKYLLFMLLGYEFGDLYVKFFHYYDVAGWILIPIVIIGGYFLYTKSLKAVFRAEDTI